MEAQEIIDEIEYEERREEVFKKIDPLLLQELNKKGIVLWIE